MENINGLSADALSKREVEYLDIADYGAKDDPPPDEDVRLWFCEARGVGRLGKDWFRHNDPDRTNIRTIMYCYKTVTIM